jgi:magnesium transporter
MAAKDEMVLAFCRAQPDAAAKTLEAMPEADAAALLAELPEQTLVEMFGRLHATKAAALLLRLDPERGIRIIPGLDPGRARDLLMRLPPDRREHTIRNLPEEGVTMLRRLIRYDPHTAAGVMDPQVTAMPDDLTVDEAIRALRTVWRASSSYVYVTDASNHLVGILNMRDLLVADGPQLLRDVMRREVFSVPASMDREELPAIITEKHFFAIPVVDEEHRLLGAVRHTDILKVAQAEASEDIQRMFGAGAEERVTSPMSFSIRMRLPWLFINLATAFLAAFVVGLFEETIVKLATLAIFLPVVAGQGGNTGAQALAVVLRGLALKELRRGKEWEVVRREALLGLVNGVSIAAGTGLVIWLWTQSGLIAAVTSAAMVINMMAAGLAGSAIPILSKAMGQDPAQSSSIIMTTVTDCVGMGCYLGLATLAMAFFT